MDASTFSFTEAKAILQPHVTDLPFKRLSDYSEPQSTVESRRYHFRIFPRHLTVPVGLSMESLLYAVFIQFREVIKGEKVIEEELFFERPIGNNQKDCWLCRRTEYSPAHISTPTIFYSRESEMWRTESEATMEMLIQIPDNFPELCWDALEKWIRESICRRTAVNERLTALAFECGQKKKEAQRFIAHY